MAGKVLVFKKNGTIEVRNTTGRTRRSLGARKIEAAAREFMNRNPGRFKTLEEAIAFVTSNNINKAGQVYDDYCVGPDSLLTEAEYIEKSERPSATELILKGVAAVPHGTFTEKLAKVLKVWPDLAHEWHRGL